MFTREMIINNITSALSFIESEIKMKNIFLRHDIDYAAEDFFCGLLNLAYGYQFENENRNHKNAIAIDLSDRQNRIAVQVTAKNTSGKIKECIKKFIDAELYNDFDTLLLFLLKKKKKYTTAFETDGKFCFCAEHHILDIDDLAREISRLDDEKLNEINDYIKANITHIDFLDESVLQAIEKMDEHLSDKIDSYVKKTSKQIKLMSAAFLTFILISFAAFLLLQRNQPYKLTAESEIAAEVYRSYLSPYTSAGWYKNCSASSVDVTEIETDKAFSITSFIRNNGSKVSSIENVYCDILSLESVREPVLILDAEIVGNRLRLFAFNDGWERSDSVAVTNASVYNGQYSELKDICSKVQFEQNSGIAAANAVFLAEYTLDIDKFQKFQNNYGNSLPVKIEAAGENGSFSWDAYLSYQDNKFSIGYGGKDGGEYSITLFEVLDVDAMPSKVCFSDLKKLSPAIDDFLRIETVLAPTKSCIVKCRNVYDINGGSQQTEEYTIAVNVPAFEDSAAGLSGPLTAELAQLQTPDELQINRIIKKYFYNPENILEDSVDSIE